jgi:HEPN domain-containing protein
MPDSTDPLAWVARAEENYALERLAAYAVQVRYPGEDPSVQEAQEALQVARVVRRFARKLLELR